ncbi:MAG: FUSC family protein [Bryobacteraceae bacterium]
MAKIAPDIAVRNTIGIVLPLVVGAALGSPSGGVVGALGALNVCYSDSRDPYIARAGRMLLSSVLVAIAVAIGSLSGHTKATAVLAAALWAFAAAMLGVLGTKAADLGTISLVTLVVFAARPLPVDTALESALVAFAGGLLQTVLSVAVWPLGRYRPERQLIADLYRTLSKLASTPAGPESPPPGSNQLIGTEDALTSLAQDRSLEADRYIFLLNQAERIRLSLLTLRRLHRRMAREEQGSEVNAALERILATASLALESVSSGVIQGRPIGAAQQLTEAARQFRERHEEDAPPFLAALIRDASHQIDALAGQLRSAARLSGNIAHRESEKPWRLRFTGWRARLFANLSLESTVFRHAVRLALCVGVGETIGLAFNLQRTYWLPMTIAIVLKPDFTATFSRGILRIAGTFAGLLLATGLFHFLHTGIASDIALLAVFTFLLRWVGPANYGIFVIAISAFVVLLIAITGVDPQPVIAARAINTAIGGALALVAYWLWPTWEHPHAGPVLADLIEAYRNYFRAVADAYARKADAALDGTRSRARVARANAEAFLGRIAAEPGISPERANLLNAILVSSHGFVRATMALESDLYLARPDPPSQATLDFEQKVDETLLALVHALRTSAQLPHDLPDLRAAHNLIEDRYSLVGVETDRIVTSLNTLREQIAKLFHC